MKSVTRRIHDLSSIVEDSLVSQEFLAYVLKSDPVIQVVGIVSDGIDALQAVTEKRPDVVTMDIHMPKMNGYEATRLIMENSQRLSSWSAPAPALRTLPPPSRPWKPARWP